MEPNKWKQKWKQLSNLRKWRIWRLKLIDARLYFVSIFVGLLTGLIAVPIIICYGNSLISEKPSSLPIIRGTIMLSCSFLCGPSLSGLPDGKEDAFDSRRRYSPDKGGYQRTYSLRPSFQGTDSKFFGGILALSAGLSLGREGPSVQIGSYIGTLVSRWGHILKGERKQLLAAGAGAGLSAAFAAPLSSSLLVIESIERFDAPKTAITTLLAGRWWRAVWRVGCFPLLLII